MRMGLSLTFRRFRGKRKSVFFKTNFSLLEGEAHVPLDVVIF